MPRSTTIVLAAAAVAAPIAAAQSVPAKDQFKAGIASGTGSLRSARGNFEIDLAHGSAGPSITLDFQGNGCKHKQRCHPNGKLHGTMNPVLNRAPDVGTSWTINASGRLKPLGHVTVTGSARGTGFIVNGYETMALSIKTKSGTLEVHAKAGPVHGFTSP